MGTLDGEVVKHLLGEPSAFDLPQTWEFTYVLTGTGRNRAEALTDALKDFDGRLFDVERAERIDTLD